MIRKFLVSLAVSGLAISSIAASSPGGTAVTLGGRSFTVGDWGYPYWSGSKEIYSAHTFKGRVEPHARATISIEKGATSAGWNIDWTEIDRNTAGTSCAEEERIIRDLANLAGLTVQNFIVGRCKTTWMQSGDRALGTEGAFDFVRKTPAIAPTPKLPSGSSSSTTPSPQGTYRFAPLGRGTSSPTQQAAPTPPTPPRFTAEQELAEIALREKLNRDQAAFAARQLAENDAAKQAFAKANAEREATIARQQAEHRAAVAAVEAEKLRLQREHEAAMAKWRADVAACEAGDKTRCKQE